MRRTLWNCRVAMRDGVELAADVVIPSGDGPFPTVVTRTPYARKPGIWMHRLVDAGYAYVMVDVRGRGDSDGEFIPFVHDDDDGHDTVEWAASQSWSTGRVGMVGLSYEGLTQWWAARARPPHLRCIAPMAIGVAKRGPRPSFDTGVPHLYWAWWFHQVSGRTQQHYGAPSWGTNIQHLPLRSLHDKVGTARRWWPMYANGEIDFLSDDHAFSDDDWKAFDVPTLVTVGWWDDQTTMDTWLRLRQSPAREQARLLIGAWDHGGNRAPDAEVGGYDVAASVMDTVGHVEQFLARHLKDEETMDVEQCRVFRTGAMRWEELDSWPAPESTLASWHLGSDASAPGSSPGFLSQATPATSSRSYVFDPAEPARDFTNLDLFAWSDPPLDQRYLLRRSGVLGYAGPVLDQHVDVSGQARFEGFVSLDAPDADLSVMLLDVHPDGRSMLVGGELGSSGLLRLSTRCGDRPALLAPGEIAHVQIPLVWLHHRFNAGHRIALAVTSSAFPSFARNSGTGEAWPDAVEHRPVTVTLHHGEMHPSRLVMPVQARQVAT